MRRIVSLLLVLAVAINCSADTGAEKPAPKKKELPKSGVLSVTGGSAGSKGTTDGVWGEDSMSTQAAPISGSVSRGAPGKYSMHLVNNSKSESFSASVAVVQVAANGHAVKTDNFSYSLKPGQSAERDVNASSNATSAYLKLLSWRSSGHTNKKNK